MKYIQKLKLKASKIKPVRAATIVALKEKQEAIKGIKSQVKAVTKASSGVGQIASEKINKLLSQQREQYGHTTPNLKAGSANLFNKNFYKEKQKQAAYMKDQISEMSLQPEFDTKGVKNLMTKAAVSATTREYGTKIKKKQTTPGERPVYQVDYSDVPEEKKKAAKVAIRKARRQLSKKGAALVDKLMGMIKKIYFKGARIQDSEQVFDAVIDVVKAGEVTDDNIGDVIGDIMNKQKWRYNHGKNRNE